LSVLNSIQSFSLVVLSALSSVAATTIERRHFTGLNATRANLFQRNFSAAIRRSYFSRALACDSRNAFEQPPCQEVACAFWRHRFGALHIAFLSDSKSEPRLLQYVMLYDWDSFTIEPTLILKIRASVASLT